MDMETLKVELRQFLTTAEKLVQEEMAFAHKIKGDRFPDLAPSHQTVKALKDAALTLLVNTELIADDEARSA